MKQGSGDDPFADLDDEDDEEGSEVADEEESSQAEDAAASTVGSSSADSAGEPLGSSAETDAGADPSANAESSTKERYTDSDGDGGADTTTASTASNAESAESVGTAADVGDDSGQTKAEADGIPWVLRRSRVKEDRGNVHQFFLREKYSAREDEIIEEVADELDMRQKDLQKLDVREAMVAAADPEDIAAVLREWGYEYLK